MSEIRFNESKNHPNPRMDTAWGATYVPIPFPTVAITVHQSLRVHFAHIFTYFVFLRFHLSHPSFPFFLAQPIERL